MQEAEVAALLRALGRARLIVWDRRRQQDGKTALALPLKVGFTGKADHVGQKAARATA